MKRRLLLLGIDLCWVALSPFVALVLRDNFQPRPEAVSAAVEYAVVTTLVGCLVLPLAGLNRGLWRYASLPDLIRVGVAAALIVSLSLFAAFASSRLEDVARSLPAIQWLVLVAGMGGNRVAIRILRERRQSAKRGVLAPGATQNVLLVGMNPIAELYVRSVAEFSPHTIHIVGILAFGAELSGRLLRSLTVLGPPEELERVIKELEVHGAPVDRVVVTETADRLSQEAVNALLHLERASAIEVDWLPERLGLLR